jgi:hypothetical protein
MCFNFGILLFANEWIFWFGGETPFTIIYIIWFMCVWTMIVIGGDMIMHNNIHTQVHI